MLTKYSFLTPIHKRLYRIFGKPEPGTTIYKEKGPFHVAQAWYYALKLAVGDVIAVPSVSLYIPISRNAIHKRIKEGRLSCFQFKIEYSKDDKVSESLARERPHAFVPVSECEVWLQEFNDRMVIREGLGMPLDEPIQEIPDGKKLIYKGLIERYGADWKTERDQFYEKYFKVTREKALAALPENKRKKYG